MPNQLIGELLNKDNAERNAFSKNIQKTRKRSLTTSAQRSRQTTKAEQDYSVQRTPSPRYIEIGTVSLPPAFLTMRCNRFSHLHFQFSINRQHPWPKLNIFSSSDREL